MTPAELRQNILDLCTDFAAAATTANQRIINLVGKDITAKLEQLIPDEQKEE